jgi:predicted PurR-regulated permease PerM
MTAARQLRFWLIGLLVFLVAVFLLRSILLPFVAGMAVAYLLDPVCDRLEAMKLSRTLATVLVTLVFVLIFVTAMLLLLPLLASQIVDLLKRVPGYITAARATLDTLLALIEARVDPEIQARIQEGLATAYDSVTTWAARLITELVTGGVALANFASLVVITPVVTFYLLRDWDHLVARIDGWLPQRHAAVIRAQAHEVDRTLAGFLRGQGTVCLLLGVFYAAGLTIAGLDFGLVIGLIAGLLTFIPYVGSIVGLILSVGLALMQFGLSLEVGIIAAIFFVGQVLEGNFLTPKLVGDQVGLHPVWVIFGLLAGGALFGFVGVLLAVPVTAVVGVGVRFALSQYLQSPYYLGAPAESGAGDEEGGAG